MTWIRLPWAVRLGSCGLAASLMLCAVDAQAQAPKGVTLSWQAPEGCGSAEEVYARLGQALGSEWSAPSEVAAQALVTADGNHLRLGFSATVDRELSRRDLEVDSCEAAVVATALFTLLAVAPGMVEKLDVSALEPGENTPAPDAPSDAEPEAPVAAPAPPSENKPKLAPAKAPRKPSEEPLFGAHASLGGLVQTGAIAKVAGGAEAAFGLHTQRLSFGVRGQWLPPRRTQVGEGASVEMGLLGAGLDATWLFHVGRITWGPSVGVGVNFASGSAVGTTAPESGSTSWLAIGAGLGLDWSLSERWALSGSAGAEAPLRRPIFSIQGLGAVHRPDSVQVKAGLGVSFELVSRK